MFGYNLKNFHRANFEADDGLFGRGRTETHARHFGSPYLQKHRCFHAFHALAPFFNNALHFLLRKRKQLGIYTVP